ncbi:hypothetical protein VTJ83DRAFT_332 [Remersonia thermophila]|uniref:Symplekin/Pta1 N-terminal domain-containing protein n=1 Tax=Remersonia thermophila TaxID=72144 RepID=A0ABR4DKP9_9PEZI
MAADGTSSSSALSVAEQLEQLNAARKLVLENSTYYAQIVKGVLPIIGPQAPVELRRWGAEFLAESLATPVLSMGEKEGIAVTVLETLRHLIEAPSEDAIVLKASIAAAASAYPVVVRWIINNAWNKESWENMSAIKSRILRIWDGALAPVKICCIKFAQRVVLAQTVSNGMEHKHNGLDVSLNMIPENHSCLDRRQLEAEAIGLLDRTLGILQDNSSDVLLVDATINCLSILARTRPGTTNRILNAVLNFNPLRLATSSPMTPKTKVLVRSLEKTTRMFLAHLLRREPNHPMAGRIQQYLEKLMRQRAELYDEANRKRPADQVLSAAADAKRQRMDGAAPLTIPPLGPGPHTLAKIFTLTDNLGLQGFDVTQLPAELAAKIAVRTLEGMDQRVLDFAVNGVRDRLATLSAAATAAPSAEPPAVLNAATAPLGVDEDDDDYEPDLTPAEDTEQILNKLDNAPPEEPVGHALDGGATLAALGPFKLPPPPALDPDTAAQLSQAAASRVFAPLASLKDGASSSGGGAAAVRRPKAGINRLAAASFDRDSWLTVITRLATRSTAGLDDEEDEDGDDGGEARIKAEEGTTTSLGRLRGPSLGDAIREMLYNYILEDWRRRIDVAVAWLCEEWYCDQVAKRRRRSSASAGDVTLHYEKWALRVVDGLLSYVTAQDKVLTRFLAEIPELNRAMLSRLKGLCADPTTVQLALTSLLYLVMMRPPVREAALDVVGEIWTEFEDARPLAAKYLAKWRPGFIESQARALESGALPANAMAVAT